MTKFFRTPRTGLYLSLQCIKIEYQTYGIQIPTVNIKQLLNAKLIYQQRVQVIGCQSSCVFCAFSDKIFLNKILHRIAHFKVGEISDERNVTAKQVKHVWAQINIQHLKN